METRTELSQINTMIPQYDINAGWACWHLGLSVQCNYVLAQIEWVVKSASRCTDHAARAWQVVSDWYIIPELYATECVCAASWRAYPVDCHGKSAF